VAPWHDGRPVGVTGTFAGKTLPRHAVGTIFRESTAVVRVSEPEARPSPVRKLILLAFVAATIAGGLSFAGVIPLTSMAPPILFAGALILTLLHLIDDNDRRF